MIIRRKDQTKIVSPQDGSFVSHRYLLEQDGMGYTLTETRIPPSEGWHFWHYKKHLEACLCVSGEALVKDAYTGVITKIEPGTMYALNEHDAHYFKAITHTVLVCVFNPPLKGAEIHKEDGSYE